MSFALSNVHFGYSVYKFDSKGSVAANEKQMVDDVRYSYIENRGVDDVAKQNLALANSLTLMDKRLNRMESKLDQIGEHLHINFEA